MKKSLFIIPFIFLFACTGQHKKLNEIIEKSTKVEIYVSVKDSAQTELKIYESSDPVRIKEFENYFTDKHTQNYKYSYTGKIVFKNSEKDVNVMFNLKPESTHIAYMIGFTLYTMNLSEKGLDYLKTITANIPIQPVQQHKE